MKRVQRQALAICAALLTASAASAQDYTIGFSGPDAFEGDAGATVSGNYTADVTHAGDGAGCQGWSLGMTAEGGKITSITTDGTDTEAVFNSGFNKTRLALAEDNNGKEGAVSAVVLCFGCPNVLPRNMTASALALGVEWTIPDANGTGTLKYEEGLVGDGQPVELVITENGLSAPFNTEELSVALNVAGGGGPGCCDATHRVGFSTAALVNENPGEGLIDDSADCSAAGAVTIASGDKIYASAATNDADNPGVQGWSLSIESQGDVMITAVTTDGTSGETRFDSGFNKTRLATAEDNNGKHGAVSAVVLCFGCPNTLAPVGTESMIAMTLEGTAGQSSTLAYIDGLIGEGQPVENVITVEGRSVEVCNISTASAQVTIEGGGGNNLGPFVRGDANDDGRINISDPIWIVEEVFRQGTASPCQESADANDDGMVDMPDIMHLLMYLFEGGAAPSAPFPDCGTVPAVDGGLTCESFSGC